MLPASWNRGLNSFNSPAVEEEAREQVRSSTGKSQGSGPGGGRGLTVSYRQTKEGKVGGMGEGGEKSAKPEPCKSAGVPESAWSSVWSRWQTWEGRSGDSKTY